MYKSRKSNEYYFLESIKDTGKRIRSLIHDKIKS